MSVGYLVDIDGVLRLGDRPIQTAIDFIERIQQLRIPYLIITNNSTATARKNSAMLSELGIEVPPSSIVTSALVTAQYISETSSSPLVYVVGMKGLVDTIRDRGIEVGDKDPTHVVVGLDVGFTYDKMRKAATAIRNGSIFIATNTDSTFPMPEGIVPGAGAIVSSIKAASGKAPIVLGKPHEPIFAYALERMALPKDQVFMVGDRISTDIVGAKKAGLKAILVTTGISRREDVPRYGTRPDIIVDSLSEIDVVEPL